MMDRYIIQHNVDSQEARENKQGNINNYKKLFIDKDKKTLT